MVRQKILYFSLIFAGVAALLIAGTVSIVNVNAADNDDLIALGRDIFYDTHLSRPVGQSCASCHDPVAGYAHPNANIPTSQGAIQSRYGNRNANSITYAMFSPELYYDPNPSPGVMEGQYKGGLFWDSRADTLEEQAKGPFLNPLEMHNPNKNTVVLTVRQSNYADLFKNVFGASAFDDINIAYDNIASALAAYMRSPEVNPFTSKYDYWKAGQVQLTEDEYQGYLLFTGSAKCKNCHPEPYFTNFGHQNLGVPRNPDLPYYFLNPDLNPDGENYIDLGLGAFLRTIGVPEAEAAMQDGKMKIPSLRNVAITPPYEHNGYFNTLTEVVMFNNTRDVPEANWPAPEVPQNVHRHMPPMPGTFGQLGLSDVQVDQIVAFLQTLTDGYQP